MLIDLDITDLMTFEWLSVPKYTLDFTQQETKQDLLKVHREWLNTLPAQEKP